MEKNSVLQERAQELETELNDKDQNFEIDMKRYEKK